jgi:hypothetical protein
VPIPPQLVWLLRAHIHACGIAPDGRLFRAARAGILHESSYGRTWHAARAAALGPDLAATPAARRPDDLRHAALSLWLASGAPPAEIAARAGHSTRVLLSVYAHCVPGHDQITDQAIEHAPCPPRGRHPPRGAPPGRQHAMRPAAGPRNPVITRPDPVRQASAHSYPQRDSTGPSGTRQAPVTGP